MAAALSVCFMAVKLLLMSRNVYLFVPDFKIWPRLDFFFFYVGL